MAGSGGFDRALRRVGQVLLAAALGTAGTMHFLRAEEFLGQVPTFFPWREEIVLVSGVIEIGLGLALLLAVRGSVRLVVGWVVAAFFVLVFPGNVWQALSRNDAFGLETDLARVVRLFFQPVLVAWALWCTEAWAARRSRGAELGGRDGAR